MIFLNTEAFAVLINPPKVLEKIAKKLLPLLDDLVVGLHGITGHLDDNITILQANLIGLQNNLMTIQANSESHQRNFELHQRDFDENQQSTNVALERLEAILLRLIDRQTPP
jgi:hypothetical protein